MNNNNKYYNGRVNISKTPSKSWNLFHQNEKFHVTDDQPSDEALKIYHKTVKKVVYDIEKFSFTDIVGLLFSMGDIEDEYWDPNLCPSSS